MNRDKQSAYESRTDVLKLLSDDEVASVRMAETTAQLTEGEEYFDLAHLDKGVLRAKAKHMNRGPVLPKKAVHHKTWDKFLAHLAPVHSAGAPRSP